MLRSKCRSYVKLFAIHANRSSFSSARLLLHEMPEKVVASSRSTIHRFFGSNDPLRTYPGFFIYNEKLIEMPELSSRTFVRLLSTCIRADGILNGMQLHCLIIKSGFHSDAFVGSALIDMYSKCGSVNEARLVFGDVHLKDLVLWNVMVSCCTLNNLGKEAFKIFELMRSEGYVGDGFTFSSLLDCCSFLGCCHLGRQMHSLVVRLGLDLDVVVSSALVDMYAKCGDITNAHQTFDLMEARNVISWNVIIVGYGQYGDSEEAVKLFSQMLLEGFKPDETTLASVLSSCADLAASNEAIQVHQIVVKNGFQAYASIGNALITAYAKSGSIHNAFRTFCSISEPNRVTWCSMVSACAFHGLARVAIDVFQRMLHEGVRPDMYAFLSVLSACSHAGLVEAGLYYFRSMIKNYKIGPTSEHYACLIDLLGRAGHLDEAFNILSNVPFKPDANVLGAFIGACKVHGNSRLAKWAADKLFSIEPFQSVNYMLISNVYAALGCWEDVAKVRRMMRDRCGYKVPGCSWIEIGGMVHTFVSHDKSHPQTRGIYNMLEALSRLMKKEKCKYELIFMNNEYAELSPTMSWLVLSC